MRSAHGQGALQQRHRPGRSKSRSGASAASSASDSPGDVSVPSSKDTHCRGRIQSIISISLLWAWAQYGWIFNNRRQRGNQITLDVRTKDKRNYERVAGFLLFSGKLFIRSFPRPSRRYTRIAQLAELAGVSRSTISRIEAEQTNGTLFVFQKIANALGIPLSEIITSAEQSCSSERN